MGNVVQTPVEMAHTPIKDGALKRLFESLQDLGGTTRWVSGKEIGKNSKVTKTAAVPRTKAITNGLGNLITQGYALGRGKSSPLIREYKIAPEAHHVKWKEMIKTKDRARALVRKAEKQKEAMQREEDEQNGIVPGPVGVVDPSPDPVTVNATERLGEGIQLSLEDVEEPEVSDTVEIKNVGGTLVINVPKSMATTVNFVDG